MWLPVSSLSIETHMAAVIPGLVLQLGSSPPAVVAAYQPCAEQRMQYSPVPLQGLQLWPHVWGCWVPAWGNWECSTFLLPIEGKEHQPRLKQKRQTEFTVEMKPIEMAPTPVFYCCIECKSNLLFCALSQPTCLMVQVFSSTASCQASDLHRDSWVRSGHALCKRPWGGCAGCQQLMSASGSYLLLI